MEPIARRLLDVKFVKEVLGGGGGTARTMLRAHQADLDSLSFILLLARRPWIYVYAIDILINGFHTQRESSRSNSNITERTSNIRKKYSHYKSLV